MGAHGTYIYTYGLCMCFSLVTILFPTVCPDFYLELFLTCLIGIAWVSSSAEFVLWLLASRLSVGSD